MKPNTLELSKGETMFCSREVIEAPEAGKLYVSSQLIRVVEILLCTLLYIASPIYLRYSSVFVKCLVRN